MKPARAPAQRSDSLKAGPGLAGRRILVTRPWAQAAPLVDRLTALGAVAISFPTIEIAPLEDYGALDQAIAALASYQWVIFTSANGVHAFWKRFERARPQPSIATLKVAAIGPATAQALEQRGLQVHFIPEAYVAESIAAGIGDVRGQHILLPRADIAREALARLLEQAGAHVDETAAYRTLPAAPDPHGLAELRRGVDALTFTSSSTVHNFVALAGSFDRLAPRPVVACIGPITAQTARELGLPVDLVAGEYTIDGLVAALAEHFSHPEH